MRRKLRFAVALTAALAFQASMTAAQAKPNLVCSQSIQDYCANYSTFGFASSIDCELYHSTYCQAVADDGGCYYDLRQSPAIVCF